MLISSRVVRRPTTTLIIYGGEEPRTYKLNQTDLQRVEDSTGNAAEFLTQPELVAAMESLGIQTLPLDETDQAEVASALPALAAAAADSGMEQASAPSEAEEAATPQPVGAPPSPPPDDTDDDQPSGRPSTALLVIIGIVAVAAVLALLALAGVFSGTGPGEAGTPTALPTAVAPTAEPGAPSATATTNTLVRTGPGAEYEIIGVLLSGQSAKVTGVSPDGDWWVIDFPATASGQGWVPDVTVVTENTANVPVVSPPPAPTPTATPPVVITDWQGEYFDNRNLQGDPVVVRNDPAINFDWGTNPPAAGMPSDNWSARWTITRDAPGGTYRFSVWVDDGVRVYVDDTLIIDGWQEGGARNYTADVSVTRGSHSIRVEYFQATATALIQLGISYSEDFPDWRGEYFDNPDVAGDPVFVRNDPEINFNWGGGSPAPGVPANNYSVRWGRSASFEEGNYQFIVEVEGGARLWLDGRLLIDDWTNQGLRTLQAESGPISGGDHDLRVDYFKLSGNGRITANWQPAQPEAPPTAVIAGPTEAQVGQQVAFSARNSTAAQGSRIVGYEWLFGDGTGSNDVDVVKAFPQAGTYEVRLTVTDDKGLTGVASQEIRITDAPAPPQPPTAAIIAPTEAAVGQTVTFDASGSTGANAIVSYRWTFGDGGTADAVRVDHVYNQAGVYNVTLVVIDSVGLEGQASTQINITEGDQPTLPPTTPPLEGTSWRLSLYANTQNVLVPVLAGTEITALFGQDGTLTGSAGCNTYNATYQTDGSAIAVGPASASNAACATPEGIMEQESAYLSLLPRATTYQVVNRELRIFDSNGTPILQYTQTPG